MNLEGKASVCKQQRPNKGTVSFRSSTMKYIQTCWVIFISIKFCSLLCETNGPSIWALSANRFWRNAICDASVVPLLSHVDITVRFKPPYGPEDRQFVSHTPLARCLLSFMLMTMTINNNNNNNNNNRPACETCCVTRLILEFARLQIDNTRQALRKPFLKPSTRASVSLFVALHWHSSTNNCGKGKIVHINTLKAYTGRRGIAPLILNLRSKCRWVISFTLWLLYPR